jgi:hypothetical protein
MRENFELEKIFSMIDPIRFGLWEILVLLKMWYFKKKKTRDVFQPNIGCQCVEQLQKMMNNP